ncbi:MAG TPA: DUF2059 domain-containing protein [Kiritimatiellia bacterium]|nr:DUF2059 domain-containing protein [Kiritimatiellia bacterium]HMP34196.1 DUF2059 domain-containing protein [Kiritimatiellia bacterium]
MKHRIILITVLLVAATAIRADEEGSERKELAVTVLDAMNFCDMIDQTLDQMKEAQQKNLSMRGMTSSSVDLDRTFTIIRENMPCDDMKQEMAAIYAQVFTTTELRGIRDFFTSEVGQTFNSKQPELMRRSMEVSMKRVNAAMMKAMEEMRRERSGTGSGSGTP